MASVLTEAFLDLFYPHTCPMCGQYIEDNAPAVPQRERILCGDCLHALPRTEQALIQDNDTEMTLWGSARSRAAAKKVLHLDHAAAFLFFEKEHPVQDMIHAMKYAERPEIGFYLGKQAAIEFQYTGFFDGIDVIMPVPLHPKRLRERGYNQSEYIAAGLSRITGIPIDTTHLTRIKNTPKQALQRGEQRKQNVSGAFAVNHPEQMYHKHILLVDDLLTTGETVRSCLSAMRLFRGAVFSVFALCKAR
ncbi:MAG: ComF family protein [Paludibacteraceae bacterium]|nr:ComF family protein [Paludibacteraceae bacterium]